jgi:hypothetical protein
VLSEWLGTSPFDLSLEDRRDDLISSWGIEIGSIAYDKLQPKLDEMYLSHLKTGKKVYQPSFDFSGKPCGSGFISSAFTCRVGVGFYGMRHASKLKGEIESALEDFEKSISRYNPKAQEFWRQTVKDAVRSANDDRRVDEATKEKWYLRLAKNARILADDGPPTKIMLKDGEAVPVSAHIYPFLSKSGNMMWKDPIQNIAFTKHRKGEMELTQNRVTFAAALSSGQVKAAIEYYSRYKKSPEMQARGPFGSAEFAKLRDVPDAEVIQVWNGLSAKEKNAVALSGVDSVGGRTDSKGILDPRSAHRKFFDDNPDMLDFRGKEVIKAYLSQTPAPGEKAISPWTGLPVELPGVRGRQQGVVDHVTALSNFYPKEWIGEKGVGWNRTQGSGVIKMADIASNMVIGESGINNGRGASDDWDSLIAGWKRKEVDYEKRLKQIEKLPMFNSGAAPSTGMSGPKPVEAKREQTRSIQRIQDVTSDNFSRTAVKGRLTQKRLGTLTDGQLRQLLGSGRLYQYQRDRILGILESRAKDAQRQERATPNREMAMSALKTQVQRYRKQGMKDSLIRAQMQTVLRGLNQETINQLF